MLKNLTPTQKKLAVFMLLAFLVRVFYVFYCTNYKGFIFSDMAGYWDRAKGRYEGDVFSYWQWGSWATFFHFYLAFLFEIIEFLHLSNHRLEVVLFLNIVYSIISIYFFYYLAAYFIKNVFFINLATLFYAFAYPIIYFNAFLLSENLSIPLLVISMYLVLTYTESRLKLFLSGLILAVAVASRPALGLQIIPFFVYVLCANKVSMFSFSRALILAGGFFLVISLVVQENSRISNGELQALAGNGGLGFFLQQCKVQWFRSTHRGYVTDIIPPTYLGLPDLARMNAYIDHQIHDQDFFYKLGFECIKRNPRIWLDNLISLRAFFFGPLFPSVPSCWGFEFFIRLSLYLLLFATASLPFMYFLIRDGKVELKKGILIVSVPAFIILTNYIWGPEYRYFYPAIFALYLSMFSFISHMKSYPLQAKIYLALIILLYFLSPV